MLLWNYRDDDWAAWRELPSLPDARGFAGSFGGVSSSHLVVAGGCNFPDRPPWEGGAKIWYDTVFALDRPDGAWRAVGALPRPLAYGVSATWRDGLIVAGGSDAARHYAEVFFLRLEGDKLGCESWPSFPAPCAYAAGVVQGEWLYVLGGLASPGATEAMRTFWRLNLREPAAGWQELKPWPGPARMLATASAQGDRVFVFSGAELSADAQGKARRTYLRDAYAYTSDQGWTRCADLPHPAVAAPSPGPVRDGRGILVIGGSEGDLAPGMSVSEHPGFPRRMQIYDPQGDRWHLMPGLPFSLVTTPAVAWRGLTVVPGGESRPGVRSPRVWALAGDHSTVP